MYTMMGLGQPQTRGDCSGWEKDPESFSKRVAEHYVRTVLKLGLAAKRISPYYPGSKEFMEVALTDELSVGVNLRGIPNWVLAFRLRHQPLGPPRWYKYSCTAQGNLELTEIPKPY
jgi:hypothetical protein